ncbi:MAG: tetratricopeptide repeat protein [Bacteroidota bacterium]|nr:tetratricopeptide repeat protein [Bacteroidota bacterium]
MIKSFYCYIIIIIVTFSIFYNSLSNEFVFDDESVIVNNASIRYLTNIQKFFTADEGFHKVIGRYYRPIVSATYTVDYAVYGLNPYGYHLTNVIIHIIACLLLFKILSTLFWRYKYRNLFSLLSTLIFAVHPIHTEAVSWISGRTDSLVTLFFFGAFLFYLEFTKEQEHLKEKNLIQRITKKNYFYLSLSLLFYVFGLLTKEMIVTLPVIIILYDLIYRKKNLKYIKENMLTYILFIAVTIIYLIVRYFLLEEIPERENYLYFLGKGFKVTYATMIKTIPVYFRLLFAPFSLLYHYNGVIPDAKTIIDTPVVLSTLFTVFLISFSVYFYKKDSIISFCILFFLVTLIPVMNIVPTMNLMAERFLYISSFALVLFICHLALIGSSKRDFSILTIGMIVIICSLGYLTIVRNLDWKDNDTLYLSAKGVEGTVILVNEGNIYANAKKYNEAENLYKRAIELRDNNLLGHHNLGLIYLLKGSFDSAAVKFKKGISIDSLAPDGYFQLATLYNIQNKKDSAVLMLEKLQTIAPDYRESEKILNGLKSGNGTDQSSITKGFTSDPGNTAKINLLQNRSYELYTEKKFGRAVKDLEELIKLTDDAPTKSGYLNNIAMCYSELKNDKLEEKYFLEAINLDPNNINAMNGCASFYLKKGETDKAKEFFNRILLVKPDDENTMRKLDSLNSN